MFGSKVNNVRQNQEDTFRVTEQNAFMLEMCVIMCKKKKWRLLFRIPELSIVTFHPNGAQIVKNS